MATFASRRFKSANDRWNMIGLETNARGLRKELAKEASRSKRLLADSDVARWHGNLREGSELTADIYVRRLDFVCQQFGVSPRSLAELDSKAACDFLLDMVQRYRSKGLAGSTIARRNACVNADRRGGSQAGKKRYESPTEA